MLLLLIANLLSKAEELSQLDSAERLNLAWLVSTLKAHLRL